jgi:hypothetical protein
MPLQNRVTPLSELIAVPDRGLVYGNRGCLHDAEGRIRRLQATRRWIGCRLEFNGWHRAKLLQPGKFTELFFLDEATAFAAGHRPCALCRREDYNRFLTIVGETGADAVDLRLDAERLDGGRRRRMHRETDLPDGAFVLHESEPWLVLGRELLRWSPGGYTDRIARPAGPAQSITPPTLLDVLRTDWVPCVPLLHPSSR